MPVSFWCIHFSLNCGNKKIFHSYVKNHSFDRPYFSFIAPILMYCLWVWMYQGLNLKSSITMTNDRKFNGLQIHYRKRKICIFFISENMNMTDNLTILLINRSDLYLWCIKSIGYWISTFYCCNKPISCYNTVFSCLSVSKHSCFLPHFPVF